MRLSFFKYLLFGLVAVFMMYSCIKKNTYPTTPEIKYKDFVYYSGDSADLQVTFTDGDGDIGVDDSDSTRTFWYTYYYFSADSQKYVGYYDVNTNDTLRIGYVVKTPSAAYKGKPISGEISVRMQQFRHIPSIKRLKYVFYLYDAAGNKSNVATSPELYVD